MLIKAIYENNHIKCKKIFSQYSTVSGNISSTSLLRKMKVRLSVGIWIHGIERINQDLIISGI